MKYYYKFPIGDASGDGHDKCEWHQVSGDLLIDEVFKAHKSSKKVLGFDLGTLFKESDKLDKDIAAKIGSLKIKWGGSEPGTWTEEILLEYDFPFQREAFVELWINLLNFINPKLNLKLIDDDYLNFYKSNIKIPGYSLFDNY